MWLFQLKEYLADGPLKKPKNNESMFHLKTNVLLQILIKSSTRFS